MSDEKQKDFMNRERQLSKDAFIEENFFPVVEWFSEQMPGGFLIYSADDSEKIIYINNSALKLFACETVEEFRELTGFTFSGLVYPEDRDSVRETIKAQIADKSNKNLDYVEYRIVRRDGYIRWVEDYGHYAELPGCGKVYFVFINDITQKKESDFETRLSLQVIHGLSQTYSCIYLLNLTSGLMRTYYVQSDFFSDISEEIGMIGGKSNQWHEVMDCYADKYVIEEDRQNFRNSLQDDYIRKKLAEAESYIVSFRCPTYDGEIVYVNMAVNRTNSDDSNERIVLSFRDVTEETIRAQNELSKKLMTDMELERQRHELEIKNRFLFGISHDIRTPMNSVMGFTSLAIKHKDDPEKLNEYLSKIDISSKQLQELIDSLLEMSSLENDEVEIVNETCRIEDELKLVIEGFAAEAENKKIRFESSISLTDEKAMTDPKRFRQIIRNLLNNAFKFTPEGGTVTLTAEEGERSTQGIALYRFRIIDTGVGISEEFIDKIYNSFERENSSTKTGNFGTGLGLSIVKKLVDIMGGRIEVKSRKNEGTEFCIELPMQVPDKPCTGKNENMSDLVSGRKKKLRVLLVEDIEFNRMLAETVLEDADFLVESVADGSDAVESIKNHPAYYYDLVLMDIQMPVMNGYEATKAIRAIKREDIPCLPIIALSANSRDEDRKRSLKSGMNSHISKPFDVTELLSIINNYTN